jgi:hypothetical protein
MPYIMAYLCTYLALTILIYQYVIMLFCLFGLSMHFLLTKLDKHTIAPTLDNQA